MNYASRKFFERANNESFFAWLLRKIFVEDWFLKLIALVIAGALWIGVNGFRETRILERVTLNLRSQDGIAITSSPKQEVDFTVTGDRRDIVRLDPHELGASVEIADTETGDRIVRLTPDVISSNLPTGIRITKIEPHEIAVRLEKILVRELPLKIETLGAPAEGFELYDKTSSLQKIRVRGAESLVSPLESIKTENIDLTDRKADFLVQQIGLIFPQTDVSVLDPIVNVSIKIGEKRIEKTLTVPVIGDSPGKTASVTLRAPRDFFEKTIIDDLKVERGRSSNVDSQPKLLLPADVSDRVLIRKIKLN